MKDELVHKLNELKERHIADLIKSGEFREWDKGKLAGKIEVIEEIIEMVSK